MKFWDMISCGDTLVVSPPTSKTMFDPDNAGAIDAQIVRLEDIVDELKQAVGNGNSQNDDDNQKTILKDKEVIQILDRLSELQVKYFPEIPLNDELTKQFVWNIPKDAYKGMRNVLDYPKPDILDPMMVLYLLLSVSPKDAIGQYWMIMNDLVAKNDTAIVENANEYNYHYNSPDYDDDDNNE